ncbi:PREDICTED: uncharacterized protein LOC105565313 [Vollenhovia emeryi]|uniref:uncharacterized protein LOC105565313 n=1 Tax=Vollenhovia emeryi TaxID=411798 RepID=UPI0005F44B3E|nr:PREDICTED: uncharacterized protein LOC105565313 [Vollenhovia emeryi]
MTVTVTPSTSDVADKAVSTDDGGSGGMEVARLEAVLAALVETKVEAMKASSTLSRRSGSAPASPRRPRLTSTSTQQQQQHNKKGQHHQHHRHRRRRHDSAPCGSDYLNNATDHSQHKLSNGRGRRRASESPRSPRKKRRHSRSPNILQGVVQDVHAGLDSRFELLGIDGDQDVALINFERAKEVLGDSCEYPRLHRSACYFSQSAAQLKIHYDDDDYVALNVADELEEEETLSGPEKVDESQGRYHRPRRKRKRKRRKIEPVDHPDEELVDPEELPPRARWTIVATACLLLAMSLLLVGVTLRMAPIIDDMGESIATTNLASLIKRESSVARSSHLGPSFNFELSSIRCLFPPVYFRKR